jgi:hypothetical protein
MIGLRTSWGETVTLLFRDWRGKLYTAEELDELSPLDVEELQIHADGTFDC